MMTSISRPRSNLTQRGFRSFNRRPQIKVESKEDYWKLANKLMSYASKIFPKNDVLRLVLLVMIPWILFTFLYLLLYVLACHSSSHFIYGFCNREGKTFSLLKALGLIRRKGCPIPLLDSAENVLIPIGWSPDTIVTKLTYIIEDEPISKESPLPPLFGGNLNWTQRENSFKLKPSMEVKCGFMAQSGGDMDPVDIEYAKKCIFLVASAIFGGYDVPKQPWPPSGRSMKLFCFVMMMDEPSLKFVKGNVTVRQDNIGGLWVGIWRIIQIKNLPYHETRRNARVPKLLTHRFFPNTQYSIWVDAKVEFTIDPLLVLERYLWRDKNTYAIAQHERHDIYEEADANKKYKRYAGPLVDLQMKIYRYEGMEPWNINKSTISDVPDSAIIIREHTKMNNLFSCLWFNEVNLFTPRDQLSFGYVVHRLGGAFKLFMFPYCEFRSLFMLHSHTRQHASKVDVINNLNELRENSSKIDKRGGLGLWSPYPGDLATIDLSEVMKSVKH